jgi:hypothetical protein
MEKKRGGRSRGDEEHRAKRGRMMDGVLHQEDMMQHQHEEHASEMHYQSGQGEHTAQYHEQSLNVEPASLGDV